MSKSEIANVFNDRIVLGAFGSVVLILILWIMNSFRSQVKQLFDRTEEQGKQFEKLKGKCEERHK